MMPIDKNLITGLILAGGRGMRMGEVDKGLQSFRGSPMVMHVLQCLQQQTREVIINANQNLPIYKEFGTQVWPDQIAGFAGPLAGIQTGLLRCQTPFMACAPCDSPLLPVDLIARLADRLIVENTDLAVAVTIEEDAGINRKQIHPVFSLMKVSVLDQLNSYLQNNGRQVRAWQAHLQVSEVLFEDPDAFRNINTLRELNEFDH